MDTVNKKVMFIEQSSMTIIEIQSPTTENIVDYVQGKTIVTPSGKKITQVMYEGSKIALNWNGMSFDDFVLLKQFIDNYGYDEFYYNGVAPNGQFTSYHVVVDGLNSLDYKIRYNKLMQKIRYDVSLKLITIP